MQLALVNRRAARKYAEFVGALETVWLVLDEARKTVSAVQGASELAGSRATSSVRSLDALQQRARRYEAELVSRDWRI